MKKIFFIVLVFITANGFAQSTHKILREGDAQYVNKNFTEAEKNYTEAEKLDRSGKAEYNAGNTAFEQQHYDEAIQRYKKASENSGNDNIKARANYNMGNAHLAKKEYEKAVEAYKNTLRIKPDDADAKKNLAFAKKQLQQQEQNKQENKNDKQNKNKQNQDKQDKSDKSGDKNNPQQNNGQDDKEKQNNQPQNQDGNPQQKPGEQNNNKNDMPSSPDNMKKEEANRMLRIMDEEERKVQARQIKKNGKPEFSRPKKDW